MTAAQSNLLLSFPKSGRTWLSYLYAYYACYRALGDSADAFIEREFITEGHPYRPLEHPGIVAILQRDPVVVPPLRVGHYFDPKPYFQVDVALSEVDADTVLFLVRDPRDVVVSFFHHTMQRAEGTRRRGKTAPAADVTINEFIRSELYGIRAIVTYMNQAAERGPHAFGSFRTVYYEDLVVATPDVLSEVLGWLGADIDSDAVAAAVRRASFANLQQLEIQRRTPRGKAPPITDALRFRRGVPRAYRDELSAGDVAYLNQVLDRHLHPAFGRYRAIGDPVSSN